MVTRRFLTILGVIVINLLLLEGVFTAYFFFQNRTLDRAGAIACRETVATTIAPRRRWVQDLVIHPFFGYVYDSKCEGINNFGFMTPYRISLCDKGYCVADRERGQTLVVGILGGSFAEQTGMLAERLEQNLKKIFPQKNIVVLNMAIGGHSLPQSAFIFTYFRELFDVAVFIN